MPSHPPPPDPSPPSQPSPRDSSRSSRPQPPDPIQASQPDLVIRARRVVTPNGIRPAAVHIRDGVITAVTALAERTAVPGRPRPVGMHGSAGPLSPPDATSVLPSSSEMTTSSLSRPPVIDLPDDEVLLPGLVDTHVHVNEPGRTDWEGFATATRAAAAGGVTTIIDMPLNSIPPTTDLAALDAKRQAAAGQCTVDVGFWGGAVPGNAADRPALHAAGVFGFKCFMVDSGVPEFPPLGDDDLAAAMRQIAELGSLLVVHAEAAASIASAPAPSGSDYAAFLASRPAAAETVAIASVIELARQTGCRVHVLHLSSADAVPLIAAARADGVLITVETCPHYLALAAERISSGATQFKCCPPIRDLANRELLWAALGTGVIDCVVSDHSPCPPELKELATGDFAVAWGGISSVQLALSVVWTQARERGYDLGDVARWMASGPARLAGLARKGMIAPGCDADLVAFAPEARFVVEPDQLLTRHRLTPYAGRELSGVVRRTWLGGTSVTQVPPSGRLLTRQ
jgi:allantoinase